MKNNKFGVKTMANNALRVPYQFSGKSNTIPTPYSKENEK